VVPQFFEFEFLFDDDGEAKGQRSSDELRLAFGGDDSSGHGLECGFMEKRNHAGAGESSGAAPASSGSTDHLPLPQQYEFALVADLDKGSRDPAKFEWHSIMQVRAGVPRDVP
jgi:hypothetical protein